MDAEWAAHGKHPGELGTITTAKLSCEVKAEYKQGRQCTGQEILQGKNFHKT